eukprot:15312742-Alexandrium_andersonii.AAC.1
MPQAVVPPRYQERGGVQQSPRPCRYFTHVRAYRHLQCVVHVHTCTGMKHHGAAFAVAAQSSR